LEKEAGKGAWDRDSGKLENKPRNTQKDYARGGTRDHAGLTSVRLADWEIVSIVEPAVS
jgi:hypothetical protein